MTVSSVSPIGELQAANGVNRTWSFDFRIDDASELQLQIIDATGAVTTVSSGFTVAGIGSESGGTVTYPLDPTPALAGVSVRPVRATPLGQPSRFGDQGSYSPEDVEWALDHLAKQILYQNKTGTERSIVGPVEDGDLDMTLPPAAVRAGKMLEFGLDARPRAITSAQDIFDARQDASDAAGSASQDRAAVFELHNLTVAERQLINSLWLDFRMRFVGASATDPVTDPFGQPLLIGALYVNTVTGRFRAFTSGGWVEEPVASAFLRRQFWVAQAGQTSFPVTGGYTPGIGGFVTYNGGILPPGDYDISDGANVKLTAPATADADVGFYGFAPFNVANTLVPANNLSDVPNKPAARTNLGAAAQSGNTTAIQFSAYGVGITLAGGGKLWDQNSGGLAGAGRTILQANNDSLDVLSEDGTKSILSATWGGSLLFNGLTVYHAGNFNPADYATVSSVNTSLAAKANLTGGTFTGQVIVGSGAFVGGRISSSGAGWSGGFDNTQTDGGGGCIGLNRSGSNGWQIGFYQGGGGAGSISTSGSTTAYNTTSDVRLKEDFQPIDGWDIIRQIEVYDFRWKRDGTRSVGVIAQELYPIEPRAVDVGQTIEHEVEAVEEYTTKTGRKRKRKIKRVHVEERHWSVDHSKLVPHLIRAVQQLEARIADLENK